MSYDEEDAKFRKMYLTLTKDDRKLLKTYCCEHGMAWRHNNSPLSNRTIYDLRVLKLKGITAEARQHIQCKYEKTDSKYLWWDDFDWEAENPWTDQPIADKLDICHYCYSNCYILGPCPIRNRVFALEQIAETSCPPRKQGEPLSSWETFLITSYEVPLQAVLQSRIPAAEYDTMIKNKEIFTKEEEEKWKQEKQ